MKAHLDWHHTTFGRFLLFIGSLRLAIPVMALVAAGMVWGTFVDAASGAKAAARLVYGSGWFIGLMLLICMSLIAAVITRLPWNRRHVGFITVHTGLIILIVGSFWSLFGRIEGQITLREGQKSGVLETNDQRLELLRQSGGEATVVAAASVEGRVSGRLGLDGVEVEIVDRWDNTGEETWVANDGTNPLRAFDIAFTGVPGGESVWIGESTKAGGPARLGDLSIRILGPGEEWTPRTPGVEPASGYIFYLNGEPHALGAQGEEAFPGWTITRVQRFESAAVSQDGLTESVSGQPNPAVDVLISDGAGTVERHTSFEKFPDMVMKKTLEGDGASGAELKSSGGGTSGGEEIVLFGEDGALRAGYVSQAGEVELIEHTGSWPWAIDAGVHSLRILDKRTHARQTKRYIEAPAASENRPALVVRIGGSDPEPLPWKASLSVADSGAFVRYGPHRHTLPFTVELEEFRKTDYPGTMMAMAYESDVVIESPEHNGERLTIFMNNPFAYDSWKVYQSGFLGDNISTFSVMRDPGLPTTYVGCVVLCVGILVVFYWRAFSRGHPGIGRAQSPVPGSKGELS